MLNLSGNVVLLSLAREASAEIDEQVDRRVVQIVDALRKRRERRWNKVLGRRADGHVIRPIRKDGRHYPALMTREQADLLRARVRDQIINENECESCGEEQARASFVVKPWGGYWPATLCPSCERGLNSSECQRDILQHEIEKAERRAGWVA